MITKIFDNNLLTDQSLGKTIKILRSFRGLDQRNFAKLIKKTPGYLSLIEHAKRSPSLDVLKTISTKLKISLVVLLYLAMERERKKGNLPKTKELKQVEVEIKKLFSLDELLLLGQS